MLQVGWEIFKILDNLEKTFRDFSPSDLTKFFGKLEGMMLTGLLTEITHKTENSLVNVYMTSPEARENIISCIPLFVCVLPRCLHNIFTLAVPMLITLSLAPQAGPSSLFAQTQN